MKNGDIIVDDFLEPLEDLAAEIKRAEEPKE
jgi:hypothetical protein